MKQIEAGVSLMHLPKLSGNIMLSPLTTIELAYIKETYGLSAELHTLTVIILKDGHTLYDVVLRCGVTLPLHSFVQEVIELLAVAIFQLFSNAYQCIFRLYIILFHKG